MKRTDTVARMRRNGTNLWHRVARLESAMPRCDALELTDEQHELARRLADLYDDPTAFGTAEQVSEICRELAEAWSASYNR